MSDWKNIEKARLVELNEYLGEEFGQVAIDTPVEERARLVAVKAHINQTRWNGDAYVTHPIRVAQKFDDPEKKAVSYLHDVVEDTELTLDNLRRFGFTEIIVLAVDSVTKRKGEKYLQFVIRASRDKIGRDVKMEDILDNLDTLTDRHKTMRDKYELALYVLENLG